MSVRMALAKLSACAVGGAVIGGGAVHVAERPAARPQAPRMTKAAVRQPTRLAQHAVRGHTVRTTTTTCAPGTVTTVSYPAAGQQYAAIPAPGYGAPLSGYGSGVPVVLGGSAGGGFGGGFFGGFFGGGSGGVIIASTGSTGNNTTSGNTTSGNTTSGNTTSGNTTSGNTTSGNTTSGNTTSGNTTSGNTTSGNTTSGNTTSGNTTSGNTTSGNETSTGNTTSGNTTTTSGNPEPVPAPPMVLLFGAAAGALVLRKRLARRMA